jgi:hypothetical protein
MVPSYGRPKISIRRLRIIEILAHGFLTMSESVSSASGAVCSGLGGHFEGGQGVVPGSQGAAIDLLEMGPAIPPDSFS